MNLTSKTKLLIWRRKLGLGSCYCLIGTLCFPGPSVLVHILDCGCYCLSESINELQHVWWKKLWAKVLRLTKFKLNVERQ